MTVEQRSSLLWDGQISDAIFFLSMFRDDPRPAMIDFILTEELDATRGILRDALRQLDIEAQRNHRKSNPDTTGETK